MRHGPRRQVFCCEQSDDERQHETAELWRRKTVHAERLIQNQYFVLR